MYLIIQLVNYQQSGEWVSNKYQKKKKNGSVCACAEPVLYALIIWT